jgi:hypothetical protein
MAEAKVRTLTVRPFQSADLAFNESGVLDRQNMPLARLGVRVTGFDLGTLYSRLSETLAGDDAKLKFTPAEIETFLSSRFLFALRRESLSSSLTETILDRENNVLERFAHKTSIIAELRKLYPTAPTTDSKVARLKDISTASEKQFNDLMAVYTAEGRLGVVEGPETNSKGKSNSNTDTDAHSKSVATGTTNATGKIDGTVTTSVASAGQTDRTDASSSTTKANLIALKTRAADSPGGTYALTVRHNVNLGGSPIHVQEPATYQDAAQQISVTTLNEPLKYDGTKWTEIGATSFETNTVTINGTGKDVYAGHSDSTAKSTASSVSQAQSKEDGKTDSQSTAITKSDFEQKSDTKDPIYYHPSAQARMQFQRGQVSLQDELLSNAVFGFRSQYFERLFDNQLKMIDLRVKQLQVAFVQRFLVSPIDGVVTGIYKDLGEHVKAGEPVLRIENADDVLIVGRVQFRSTVRVGSNVKVTTKNVFEASVAQPVTLTGTVAAIRGHDADNDEWDVTLMCDNRGPGNTHKLPINYSFDKDDVTLEIL